MDILLLSLGANIKGEVTLKGYAGQTEILSFSHAISQLIVHGLNGRTGTTGRPQHGDFTVTKYLDLSSTGILDTCDRGAVIQEVIVTLGHIESGLVSPYWVVTMNNVIITSVSMGGAGGGRPTETVTLNYTAITWLYRLQTGSPGELTTSASWNLATNTAGPQT